MFLRFRQRRIVFCTCFEGVWGINLILQDSAGRKINDVQILLCVSTFVVTSRPFALTILNIVSINFYYC